MSLKDRLSNQAKAVINIEKKEQEPAYFQSSEASQGVDTLGEIDSLFVDDDISSISVMGAKNIFIERKGKKSKISLQYRDNVRLENILRKNAKYNGCEFDEKHPFAEFSFRQGINVSATLPPLSNVATMIIKYYKDKFGNLKSLTDNQALSKELAIIIEALAGLNLNIIIAGEKDTLKTTLLSAIAKKVPPSANAVVFDYSNELKIENSNVVTYNFKNYENNVLIDNILLSNPDKVFLNDCPNLGYFDKFIQNGFRGICATLCVNNPYDVLREAYLKNSDIVIFVKRDEDKRLVSSISLVKGSELEEIFYLNEENELKSTGIVPDFYYNIEQTALPLSVGVFDAGYKHTYQVKVQDENVSNPVKKSLNPDILKKFKKEFDKKESEDKADAENVEQPENE